MNVDLISISDVIFSLTALLRVSDLGLLSTTFTPKCPSASVKPVNQLLSLKSDVSSKLSGISKEYLVLINLIKSLNALIIRCSKFSMYQINK